MALPITKVKVPRMKLGSQGLEVSALGLGCLGLSSKPEPDMINLIHHAINSGITFFDTADIYGPHINEILIGKALKGGMREKVQLASKFGIGTVNGEKGIYGDPKYVRAACESSLKRLDVDYIDLYYQHRVDTRVPIELTMGELKKLVEEGKIKYIGLCGASPSTIRRAHAVHPITAVQLEWSLQTRDSEEDIIPICRELGIGIVVYSPLGHGFLTSKPKREENHVGREVRPSRPKRDESSSQNDSEKNRPRTRSRPENLEDKSKLYDRVIEMAAKKGCTPSQLALAWLHHQGSDVCPIPGTTKIENLEQNIGALSVNLTAEDMSELELITSGEGVKGDSSAGRSSKNADTPPLESWKVE